MCCGRRTITPRRVGRSNLIKKPQQSENSSVVVPEMPEQPRQELEYTENEEQKQEEI